MATSRKSKRKESEARVKDLRIRATPEALAKAVVRGGAPKQRASDEGYAHPTQPLEERLETS